MLEELVVKYMECLDSGKDDVALYEEIGRRAAVGQYEVFVTTAEIARHLFYRKMAGDDSLQILARLDAILDVANAHGAQMDRLTLHEYVDGLVNDRGLSWAGVLRTIGVSARQAYKFQNQHARLTQLLRPKLLARLANELGASVSKILFLAKKEIFSRMPIESRYTTVYRLFPGVLQSRRRKGDGDSKGAGEYLAELEQELHLHC